MGSFCMGDGSGFFRGVRRVRHSCGWPAHPGRLERSGCLARAGQRLRRARRARLLPLLACKHCLPREFRHALHCRNWQEDSNTGGRRHRGARGGGRPRRGQANAAIDSTSRPRSACREMVCLVNPFTETSGLGELPAGPRSCRLGLPACAWASIRPFRKTRGRTCVCAGSHSRFGQEVRDRVGVVAQQGVLGIASAVQPVRFLHHVPQDQHPQPHGGRIVVV